MNGILEELSSCGLLCAALVVPMAEGLFALKSVDLQETAISSGLAVLSTIHNYLQNSSSARNQYFVFHLQEITSESP